MSNGTKGAHIWIAACSSTFWMAVCVCLPCVIEAHAVQCVTNSMTKAMEMHLRPKWLICSLSYALYCHVSKFKMIPHAGEILAAPMESSVLSFAGSIFDESERVEPREEIFADLLIKSLWFIFFSSSAFHPAKMAFSRLHLRRSEIMKEREKNCAEKKTIVSYGWTKTSLWLSSLLGKAQKRKKLIRKSMVQSWWCEND